MWNWAEPAGDALTASGVGLVLQVGLIMQIPASSSLARVKAVILMITEQRSDSGEEEKKAVWRIRGNVHADDVSEQILYGSC